MPFPFLFKKLRKKRSWHICSADAHPDHLCTTVIFEIITFLIQKNFKTVTVTVILGKLIRNDFKMVIGNQWK